MQEVLFIWAKENPLYSYQQGMNEILAVLALALSEEDIKGHHQHNGVGAGVSLNIK